MYWTNSGVFPLPATTATAPNSIAPATRLDWRATIYHTPQDDMNQPFDWNAAARHVQLQFLIGYLTAQADSRPVWNAGDFFGTKFGTSAVAKPD